MANSETVIEIQGLAHTYGAGSVFEKTAIQDINLSICKGEMVALIGHTGSGKSTLIQHMNGLLKPTEGTVFISGENIHLSKEKLQGIRQKVGLIFQYPEHQLFEATVFKDVSFGPGRMGLTPDKVEEYTKKALEVVGLDESIYEKSPFELSGGQKRRAAIAGVLAMRPEILILDEPTAGLDPRGRDEILSQIKHMHETLGITVILVSHSMDDAARLCSRIFVMNQGGIVCEGTPAQVFAQGDMLMGIGLDVPQISRLMSEMNKINPQIPVNVFTTKDAEEALLALLNINDPEDYS